MYNVTLQIDRSFHDTVGDITLREKLTFKNITANSTLYDETLFPRKNSEELLKTSSHPTENFNSSNQPATQSHQSSNISNNRIVAPFQNGYEFIDPFATKSQLNRTLESFNQTTVFNNPNLESQQVREELPNKINQITLNDSANI